jgi:hypothetical protein
MKIRSIVLAIDRQSPCISGLHKFDRRRRIRDASSRCVHDTKAITLPGGYVPKGFDLNSTEAFRTL